MATQSFETIDEYIASFPHDSQKVLEKLRKLIRDIEPNITEDMSYKMPSFKLKGKPLVYFAAWKNHISLYPTPNGMEEFENDLEPYKSGRGTARFPTDKPLPYKLIEEIVKFRVKEVIKKSTKL